MRMRIFISYVDKDGKEFAEKLNNILLNHGHDSFFADKDIMSGATIWRVIPQECIRRDFAVFIITPSFREAKGQQLEYNLVTSNYIDCTCLIFDEVPTREVFDKYPILKIRKAEKFNNENFDEISKNLAISFVKLSNKPKIELERKPKFQALPKLSTDGLDASEIENCIKNLKQVYDSQTIIPYLCSIRSVTEDSPEGYVTIGLNNLLPRHWFYPIEKQKQVYSNDFLFQDFGRDITLWEKKHLQKSIVENQEIPHFNVDFSPEQILGIVEKMDILGFCPQFIFPTIDQHLEMQKWTDCGHTKYEHGDYGRLSNELLAFEKYQLQIVSPLGKITTNTILLNKNAAIWKLITDPKYGSLSIALGNSECYENKFAQIIAVTRAKFEIDQKGASVIN